jgi:toxin ParE1/3/4
MIMKYRISEKAIADLEKIWFYTYKKWSLKQADRYHRQIINEIEYIVDNFELGRNMDHVRLGYRMSKVKFHLIFYKRI